MADLESPDQGRVVHSSFIPDGRYLIASNGDSVNVLVWDLGELRRELARLRLDWDDTLAPPVARLDPGAGGARPLAVDVEEGAIGGVRKRLAAAVQLNNDAWHLVTGPKDKRDPARALALIEEAIRNTPNNLTLLNTLGGVQYRNGRYGEAVNSLEKSLATGDGQSAGYDLFVLAMCHAQLGDLSKAKDYFGRAVVWLEGKPVLSATEAEELGAFRAEADEVIRSKTIK